MYDKKEMDNLLKEANGIGLCNKWFLEEYGRAESWSKEELLQVRAICQKKLWTGSIGTVIISIGVLVMTVITMIMQMFGMATSHIPEKNMSASIMFVAKFVGDMTIVPMLVIALVASLFIWTHCRKYRSLVIICDAHLEAMK